MDGDGFRTAHALAGGMPRGQVFGTALHRPFYGMRTLVEPANHQELCRAAAVVLPEHTFFSHRSAAVIHGLPLPHWAEPEDVDVGTFEPDRPPKLRGVNGHQLTPDDHRLSVKEGLRLVSPQDTWAQLSSVLPLADLVVIGDYLLTGDEPFSGRPPPASLEDLVAATRRHGRRRGVRTLRLALERVRYGSLSPQESRLRLALEDAGLPSPELNHRVAGPGRERNTAMIDLAYPDQRVAIEYLGDHHRTNESVYRQDIRRREWLVGLGWDVVFVTAGDAFDDVARRVRVALRRSQPHRVP